MWQGQAHGLLGMGGRRVSGTLHRATEPTPMLVHRRIQTVHINAAKIMLLGHLQRTI